MFKDYVFRKLYGNQIRKLLVYDVDNLDKTEQYRKCFESNGFLVVDYEDDLTFRIKYSNVLKEESIKIIVFADPADYVPYDILSCFTVFKVTYDYLFPRLHGDTLKGSNFDHDLLVISYEELYESLVTASATKQFIKERVNCSDNVSKLCTQLNKSLKESVDNIKSYKDWFSIAELKARIDVYCAKYRLPSITDYVNDNFSKFVLSEFGKLSGNLDPSTPVLVSKAMDYMHSKSEKFVIVVMDGMSEFDWEILSSSFDKNDYERSAAYAMIPTITSISRQCLLSNKYPSQLLNPWSQAKEKAEFISCARSLGYSDSQIGYERGYEAEFSLPVKCGAIIINDIDDLVHAQKHGREGMYDDIAYLSETHKLCDLCKRLVFAGFDVYISADHGNSLCTGLGKLIKTGVETESKSHRMVVLNEFADKEQIKDKYGMIEYPKYYLDKQYDYLICSNGTSLDNRGDIVMSHGGISIEEVIVPFIKLKAKV